MLSVTNVLIPKKKLAQSVTRYIVELPGGQETPIHIAIYRRTDVRPKLVVFKKQTPLLNWCLNSGIRNAISGGFSLHHKDQFMGEVWTNGFKQNISRVPAPWHV